MEPTKITPKKLQEIMEQLISGSEDSRGTYLYKTFRLQISKYKASGAERTSRLYHKRRELGLCIRCGEKVQEKNPRTKKLYRLCALHRDLIDHREEEEKLKAKAGRKKAAKKTTKKAAKKTTKKTAKKTTTKTAKKTAKRAYRKTTKKTAKKIAKKPTRKTTKKTAKKTKRAKKK